MSDRYDIAIAGSGFAGSLMAMVAKSLGRRVVLLERGKHPRMMIGESSTPLSNLLLEDIASRYNLPNVKALAKWGSWQLSHPELACGLKRGFTFFHHELGSQETSACDRSRQLLVAASPHDGIADTHWYRSDLDEFLVDEVKKSGVDYFDEMDLREADFRKHNACLKGVRHGLGIEVSARFVIDATGPRGFLHRILKLGERELPFLPATESLYTHFSGVKCIEQLSEREFAEDPPYPIDDAAVHHIFDGGWVWVLRFDNGTTSAGVAATKEFAARLKLSDGADAWTRILRQIPMLEGQFEDAQPVLPFRHISRLGFRSATASGPNWALLPSAAGFVDPLLSTGFPLTLLGIGRIAKILENDPEAEDLAAQLENYSLETDAELVATARLIAALYANMGNFPVFSALSLLYFAAASYSETVRRLGKPELAGSFLLHDHPRFGSDCKRVLERALTVQPGSPSEELIEEVFRIIEPFDVAGLGKRERRNWYPVESEDLLCSAHKVHASREEIMRMLDRCGFRPVTSQA